MTRKKVSDVDVLAAELERDRRAAEVRRADELARVRAEAAHGRDRADVATEVRLAELDRAERKASATAAARLARMYREAKEAGERTRIAAALARSGEARALRLERLRVLNLKVLLPVLLGFAAWSTTGVQAGAARLMSVDAAAPMWWVLWLLEPVLIGAVVWVIVARTRLASAGGVMDAAADRIAAGCLGASIALNLVAAVPAADGSQASGWAVIGAMIAHAVGPVGAAATAHLIGLVDRSIADADPWTDRTTGQRVPLLAEMDIRPPSPVPARQGGAERPAQPRTERPPVVWPVPVDGRRRLPLMAARIDDTDADAERWVTTQGEITAAQVAAFLTDQDPPAGTAISTEPQPDVDGPTGAAVTPSAESRQIEPEQLEPDPAEVDADRVAPAAAARRQQGQTTRQQIADHIARHPDATPAQIAAAVGRSVTTVRRHLTAITSQ